MPELRSAIAYAPCIYHLLNRSIAACGSGVDLRVVLSMHTSVARPVAAQAPSRKIACVTLNELRPNSATPVPISTEPGQCNYFM